MQTPRRAGGGKRAPENNETRSLLLSALAAAGAHWTNLHSLDGRIFAVAIIPKSQFTEQEQTALEEVKDYSS
jgi:hypothetical protein